MNGRKAAVPDATVAEPLKTVGQVVGRLPCSRKQARKVGVMGGHPLRHLVSDVHVTSENEPSKLRLTRPFRMQERL